jgi:hypothetical protein
VTLFQALGIFASGGAGAAAAPGMVLMNPTSIAYSGTSATLGANGQVTFSAVTSLSLNGCFTADFDNYVISLRCVASGNTPIFGRLRSSGSDATGSDYTQQYILANNTSVTAARGSGESNFRFTNSGTAPSGDAILIYGPFLAQPTATRNVSMMSQNTVTILDNACTHSLSTSYDGITIFPESGNLTGALQVYGVRS